FRSHRAAARRPRSRISDERRREIVQRRLPRHHSRYVHGRRRRGRRGPARPRRNVPRNDAPRQVRLALRERSREGRGQVQVNAGLSSGGKAGVILVGELSLWVALLMAAWAATVSFAGGALARRDLV